MTQQPDHHAGASNNSDLERAFAQAYAGGDPDSAALLDAVSAYTDEMKAAGHTAEHIIITIKQAANRSGAMYRRTPRSAFEPSTTGQALVSDAVKAAIDRFYGGEKRS